MIELLSEMVRRVGVQTVLAMTLLLIALDSTALGLQSTVRGPDVQLMLLAATMGLVLAWGLAASPLPGWLAGIVGGLVGLLAMFIEVGHLGGRILFLVRQLAELVWELGHLGSAGWPNVQPALTTALQLGVDVRALALRVIEWGRAMIEGAPAFDPVAAALVWALAVWCVAGWAGWTVRRRARALEAMLPALTVLAGMLAYAGGDWGFLVAFLGATLLLMALVGHSAREHGWESAGIGFSEEIRFDLAMAAIPLAFLLITLAVVTPSISVQQVVQQARRLMEQTATEPNRLPDSLGIIPAPSTPSAFDPVRAPGLPRQHLIGAGSEPTRNLVMVIRTDELRPGAPPEAAGAVSPPHYYWRASTYDYYSGRGWFTSPFTTGDYAPGEQSGAALGPSYRAVRQRVEIMGHRDGLLYATGTLVSVDQPFRVAWRSPEDAFGASIQTTQYTVESRVPIATEAQLRSAGPYYPEWVRTRYLALPEGLSERVLVLARDLTSTAPTPYDRARAIEAYLRKVPYSLDVPAPPPNREVADFFLFDLRKGYCDYYATTMAVLARAAGLAARLVVGYASGSYDPQQARYLVTGADAHSWVEVYFPGYGWIEFEPTGGYSALDLPSETVPPSLPEPRTMVSSPSAWVEQVKQGGLKVLGMLAGGFVLFLLGAIAWSAADEWRLRRLAPRKTIDLTYRRLCRFARRLNIRLQDDVTPNELAARLSEQVVSVAYPFVERAQPALTEISALTALYVQACYSVHRPESSERAEAIRMWKRLRRRLVLAWIRQNLHKGAHRLNPER